MSRFVRQLLCFVLVQWALVGLVSPFYTVDDAGNYLAETAAKHARLQALPGPKLVLVGGSSAAFGFSSDLLETAVGRPVVNMGLMAGLGVEYMLAEIRSSLKPGDAVVLSFEYEHFARKRVQGEPVAGFDPDAVEQVLEYRPSGVMDLGWDHVRRLLPRQGLRIAGTMARRLTGSLWRAIRGTREPEGSPSARRGFNDRGDFVWHRGAEARSRRPALGPAGPPPLDAEGFPNRRVLDLIRDETRALATRGVRVAWSFPPRPEELLLRQPDLPARLEVALRGIEGLVVLDAPSDHAYPWARFYDAENHLDGPGAGERTARLARAWTAAGFGPARREGTLTAPGSAR